MNGNPSRRVHDENGNQVQRANASRPCGASFEETWRERFQEFAEGHDDDAGIAGWSQTGLEARMRRFARLWQGRRAGARWLDAGCGAGSYGRWLLDQGVAVISIDYSLPTIAKARARSGKITGFAVADVRQLPFPPRVFDGVVCFGVTQALADSTAALQELSALVTPGGEVWIDGLNRCCVVNTARILWRGLRRRRMHLRYESPQAISGILRAQGFRNVAVYWMPIVPARWWRLQALVELRSFQRLLQLVPLLGLVVSHAFIVHGARADTASHNSTSSL